MDKVLKNMYKKQISPTYLFMQAKLYNIKLQLFSVSKYS